MMLMLSTKVHEFSRPAILQAFIDFVAEYSLAEVELRVSRTAAINFIVLFAYKIDHEEAVELLSSLKSRLHNVNQALELRGVTL
jgi:hypothetical protein